MTVGEEVEMVNSFLSRVALTTKYMTKSGKKIMFSTICNTGLLYCFIITSSCHPLAHMQ